MAAGIAVVGAVVGAVTGEEMVTEVAAAFDDGPVFEAASTTEMNGYTHKTINIPLRVCSVAEQK